MRHSLLAGLTFSLLTPFVAAQLPSGMPVRMPGMPMVPPPAGHPALGAQPGSSGETTTAPRRATPTGREAPSASGKPEETSGAQLAGKDLKKAVAKVRTLQWGASLEDAFAKAAGTGKPVLWLQALGDLGGFA